MIHGWQRQWWSPGGPGMGTVPRESVEKSHRVQSCQRGHDTFGYRELCVEKLAQNGFSCVEAVAHSYSDTQGEERAQEAFPPGSRTPRQGRRSRTAPLASDIIL
ncbi:hypothetical protein FALBO_17097 [Fusarium albosuccineum]|uniref:Uncharacterized protein n=1 Tax=Fusarium albosuccineum TaxID=1237068 RepID=A0A8H4K9K1_9HYPO|nr:hypothetical protein FALBO_17097 [Fusarium albosuccineum]